MRVFFAFSMLLATLFASSVATAAIQPSPLGTPDQIEVETLALKLMNTPEVKQQKEEGRKRFLALPVAASAEVRKRLPLALDALTYVVALTVATEVDPAHPKPVWALGAAHEWFGRKIPASGFGIDNPDTIYRVFLVDPASKYEITLRPRGPLAKIYSLSLYNAVMIDKPDNIDAVVSGLREDQLKPEADGSFRATMDSDPANGRVNHIQSTGGRMLMVRDMMDDWATQTPMDLEVKRTAGPPVAKLSEQALAEQTARSLKGNIDGVIAMMTKDFQHVSVPNTMSKAFLRGGNWGYTARGTFKLKDDEALLVTLENPPDHYLGMQVVDPWLLSVEHIHANGSLNNRQAERNKDGTYTYVISPRDAGVRNWLHTGGLHDGDFQARWQYLPASAAANAVREVKVVKLADVPALLPDMTRVTPAQRKAQSRQRAEEYARRYLPQ